MVAELLSFKDVDTRYLTPIYYKFGPKIEEELYYSCKPYMYNGQKVCRAYVSGIGGNAKHAIFKLR